MDKAFGTSETNAQFFYELLQADSGVLPDDKIDGSVPDLLQGGPGPSSVSPNPGDKLLQGHEVVSAAFNRLTKFYPKITAHFTNLGLDLAAMLAPDGTLKPAFVTQVRSRLEGKDAAAPKAALSYQSAQLYIADQAGISTRDPLFAEKFQVLMNKPQADRDAELKKFYADPKNAGKLVRWAFRYSEFSLLPFKDQVEAFKAAGYDEAVVKAELGSLWQGRSLPKLVAQAALFKGLELEEAAKGLSGDDAQKKIQDARFLFRAAVELDNQNPLARRRLSTHLLREGKMEGASFHLGEAVKNETDLRYLIEIAQGLAIGDKRLLAGHPDPWAFLAGHLVSAKRYSDAAAVYHEAAKEATARGDHPASLAFTEQELRIEEGGKPFVLNFTKEQNPMAMAFYKALHDQGVPSQLLESGTPDRKIAAAEVLTYLDGHWKEERVQRALKSLNFPALPWEIGAKPAYADAAFEKLPFANKMAAWHDYEIAQLKKKEPIVPEVLEKRLQLASFYESDKAERHKALADFYMERMSYKKAVEAFKAADAAGEFKDPAIKTSLGHALFGAGDFKASRDMYTLGLEKNPKDLALLKLRFEANEKYLATLDPVKDADALKPAQAEYNADGALALALDAAKEKTKLADMEKLLAGLHDGDQDKARTIAGMAGLKPEEIGGITKKDAIAAVEGLAQNYLSLAEQTYADPKDAELVRTELNGLAAECFAILGRFAADDKDPEIQRMSKVYEGYTLIAQGKIDEGVAILTPLRKIPQADRILKTIEKGKMRLTNLAAVETWSLYNQEMEQVETSSAKGWMSGTSVAGVSAKWAKEKAIHQAVKEKLESGDADSMEAALKLIAETGSEELKERAKYYLSTESRANGTGPIGDLVTYASGQPPADTDAQRIMAKSFDNEVKGAINSSLAMYVLIHTNSPEADLKQKAQANIDGLTGKATFGRSVEKFFKMHSGEGLAVDIGIMFLAAGFGNLAKLRMLMKLEQAGVNGRKAVIIASAVGIGTEATLFWGGSTIKEAMLTDPSKVFTKEHLLKSYGSSLLMIGGLKGFGKLAEGLGPRAAKSLGLVTEGGAGLTKGGKVLVWGIGHTGGMVGMVASSKANQGLGLTEKPHGGWKEGLVNDVFGYVQFAIAHKVADGLVKGKMTEVSKVQHTEIAFREGLLAARGHAETLGFKADRYQIKVAKDGTISANDKPLDGYDPVIKKAVEAQLKKGKDGAVESQVVFLESREHGLIVGLFLEAGLNRPGFNGGTLAKRLKAKDYVQANAYLKKFNLPLHFEKDGSLVAGAAGEPSPHEALGIAAPVGAKPEIDGAAPESGTGAKKPAKKDAKEEDLPFLPEEDVVPVEDGMTPEPQKLAARKSLPKPKEGTGSKVEKTEVNPLAPKAAIPEGLRLGVALTPDGKSVEVKFNEFGIALLDVEGRNLSTAESQKTPHVEIQMVLTEGGEILHHIRSVGAEKLQIVDAQGNIREVTATYKPLQDGERFRVGGKEFTWYGPRGHEALYFKIKEITVFEGRPILEEVSRIQERRNWAETFVKNQEKDYAGQESMFGDLARAFAEAIAKDPRLSELSFREAFVTRCQESLKALRPIVDKLPVEQRSELAYSFLKQVMNGHMSLGDAKLLAASVKAGNLIVEKSTPEKGLAYDYILVPAFKGVRLPAEAGMLEGMDRAIPLDFAKSVYQIVQFGDATLQFHGGMPREGKPARYFVMNKGTKTPLEIYDVTTNSFRQLAPREEAVIADGTVFRLDSRSFVFRSPESLKQEIEARNQVLGEREILIRKRAAVQTMPDGAPDKGSQVQKLSKLEQDFLDQLKTSGRGEDGLHDLHSEMTHLALGQTEFAGAAREALAGKLTLEQYRKAQTEIGKKMVEEHRPALEEVDSFLNGLPADSVLSHRFADLKDEAGEWIANPHTRLKDPADLAPKLARRGWTDLGPLTDIAGARVVVKTTNDVLPIVEAIEAKYDVRSQLSRDGAIELDLVGEEKIEGGKVTMEVTFRPDKDHPDRLTVGSSTGYRALHVVVEVNGKPVEIQIQTDAIYQWGKIQHSLVYKNKNIPKETLDELNVFCRDVAKYLTDLESGPAGANRPALPLLPKNFSAELRAELRGELTKMSELMDRYEKVAEDPGEHKTQIFKRPPGAPEPAAEDAKSSKEDTNADSPKAKVPQGEPGGRIPQRRAVAEALAQPAGIPDLIGAVPLGAPKGSVEVPLLRSPNGQVIRLPAGKAVVTLGSKKGDADIVLGKQGEETAPLQAEIIRGSDGSYHLRPLEGQEVLVLGNGDWRALGTTGKGEGHLLKAGDRIKIGAYEFQWNLQKVPPIPLRSVKPPPLPRKVPAPEYQQVLDRGKNLNQQLVKVIEVSDAALQGKIDHWESSSANVFTPDQTHTTIKGGWKHLSKAEYDTARGNKTLKDTPASTYHVRIFGEQRQAMVEARLKQEFGPRLEALEASYSHLSEWLIRNEQGEAQIKVVLETKPLKIYTGSEVRTIYTAFAKEQLPILVKWLEEPSTVRSFYAFRMTQMIGIEANGKSGYRLGGRLAEALEQMERGSDSQAKVRATEEVATMLAYIQDAKLLIPEHRLLFAADIMRDSSAANKSVAYALTQPGPLKALGESGYRAVFAVRALSERLRTLGEELRRDVARENQKAGNPVYDEYLRVMGELRQAIKLIRDVEVEVGKTGVDLEKEYPTPVDKAPKKPGIEEVDDAMILEVSPSEPAKPPIHKKRDLHGADEQPMRDLRIFTPADLESLKGLGMEKLNGLTDPTDPRFAHHLVEALDHLIRNPFKSREYESGVIRLVGAIRHWEMFGGQKIPWFDKYLRDHGRNSYGISLQSMPPPVPPPPRVPLSADEQVGLGVKDLRADNVMQVIGIIRARSTRLEKVGDFLPFRPSEADRRVLRRVMENYGGTVHATNPKLGYFLQQMFRPHEAYVADLDTKGDDGKGGKLPERRDVKGPAGFGEPSESLGEPTGAYVEKIPLGGPGKDLKSIAAPRPSYLAEIPGLTAQLEKTFDRGGRVEQWPSGKMLVEAPSGADTRIVRPATPAEAMAYLRWSQRQGFVRVETAHAEAAWKQLQARTKELGIALFLGEDAAMGQPQGKPLQEFLEANSGQVVYLNTLVQLLPANLMGSGRVKKIFLNSPRQENAHFGAFDAADGSLYLYSGGFRGSRRNLAALFLHEAGHPTAERYRTDEAGDAGIPLKVRIKMDLAHETLVKHRSLFTLDWAEGKADRAQKQAGDFSEFIADLHIAYVAAGPSLRAHIRSLPEGSPAREAWDFIYSEMRDRIFGGLEYDFSKLPPPPRTKLKLIPGGKPEAAAALHVPDAFLTAEIGPHNAVQELRLGGLAAGRDPGVGRYAHNEDRFAVVHFKTLDGRKVSRYFAIDGMGGHDGGEFAAVFTQFVLQTASRNPSLSIEAAIRLADKMMVRHPEYKRLKGEPGAVVAGVEIRDHNGEVFEVRFADVGDAEAMLFGANFELQGDAYTAKEVGSRRKLPRGQTVFARIHPLARILAPAQGGPYTPGQTELDISVETHRAKKGAIAVAGSDGLMENFISKDEIGEVLRYSGARNSAEMELALRNEGLIRMHVLADLKSQGRIGDKITHQDFVNAYRKVWKKDPPKGAWRYEGMTLTAQGHVVDMKKDAETHGIAAHIRGHFKADNISVIVQVLGEEVDGSGPGTGVRADFLPPPFPLVIEADASLLQALKY